jgi:hypothetical protein
MYILVYICIYIYAYIYEDDWLVLTPLSSPVPRAVSDLGKVNNKGYPLAINYTAMDKYSYNTYIYIHIIYRYM